MVPVQLRMTAVLHDGSSAALFAQVVTGSNGSDAFVQVCSWIALLLSTAAGMPPVQPLLPVDWHLPWCEMFLKQCLPVYQMVNDRHVRVGNNRKQ